MLTDVGIVFMTDLLKQVRQATIEEIIQVIDNKVNYFHEMTKTTKGPLKKSYEDSITSFVILKMTLEQLSTDHIKTGS